MHTIGFMEATHFFVYFYECRTLIAEDQEQLTLSHAVPEDVVADANESSQEHYFQRDNLYTSCKKHAVLYVNIVSFL